MTADPQHRHRRIRRVKTLLRFAPRRARFHRYPLIGRFAGFARRQPYLWSFRAANLTRAFYAGSILALLPVMGLQLPLALLLSLALRTNLMVVGGLQFISNPATVWVYGGTWWVGNQVIEATGLGESAVPSDQPIELADPDGHAAEPPRWSHRLGNSVNALVLGGIICGTLLGAALDLSTRLLSRYWRRTHPAAQASAAPPPTP